MLRLYPQVLVLSPSISQVSSSPYTTLLRKHHQMHKRASSETDCSQYVTLGTELSADSSGLKTCSLLDLDVVCRVDTEHKSKAHPVSVICTLELERCACLTLHVRGTTCS